ncbi:unnamed protein product [marine sediment metagenome]|uniref:Uncharacterized protein n=1 Tax=marine sediment metagenome TaxID=412755 RepID=X1GRS6_9ZZZZ
MAMVTSGKKSGLEMTEREKHKAKELLDELNEIGPDDLPDWNIRAQTFLVFMAIRNPDEFLRR